MGLVFLLIPLIQRTLLKYVILTDTSGTPSSKGEHTENKKY